MNKNRKKRRPVGETIFVQACAHLLSAAWIEKQMKETSTAPSPLAISGIAYSMRYTYASDIAMAFELALKTLMQGLVPSKAEETEIKSIHNLRCLWNDSILDNYREEIDEAVEKHICQIHGAGLVGKVLTFSEYLQKHENFFHVEIRYANPEDEPWRSFHTFFSRFRRHVSIHNSAINGNVREHVDGVIVLLSYWDVIMWNAWRRRWPDENCEAHEGLAKDRDEARVLMKVALNQFF